MKVITLGKYWVIISLLLCIFCVGIANAAHEDGAHAPRLLVIGCRPWDENIQGVPGIKTADFVDFMIEGAPLPIPSNFHHVDCNETGCFSQVSDWYQGPLAGKLSDFARTKKRQFDGIIIDFGTFYHLENPVLWGHLGSLLKPGGFLVIPVTESMKGILQAGLLRPPLISAEDNAKRVIQEIIDSSSEFTAPTIQNFNFVDVDSRLTLLTRFGATKKNGSGRTASEHLFVFASTPTAASQE